jgi:excisionase family DNA binding protein
MNESSTTFPVMLRGAGDLAEFLRCSRRAAARMIERGQVPVHRIGRRVFIVADELMQMIRAN